MTPLKSSQLRYPNAKELSGRARPGERGCDEDFGNQECD